LTCSSTSARPIKFLARGTITNHDEITVILIEPHRRHTAARTGALAATPHNSRRHALPCWGGGDRQDHRRECHGAGTTQGGRTMNNNLKAFVLSVGGLLAVAGSGLLVLWAVLS
jgi:hypothetical protein